MLRRLLAIALHTVRTTIRSRLVICLLALLLLTVAALPHLLKGDGTLAGEVRILLYYTLGLAWVILACATLWTAAGALARDISGRQMQLLVVKPVRRTELWWGTWLGLLALNACLLAAAGATVYVRVQWVARRAPAQPAEREELAATLLSARLALAPRPAPVAEEARRQYAALTARGVIPPDQPEAEALAELRRLIRARLATVPPGTMRTWLIDLPSPPRHGPPPRAVMQFSLSRSVHAQQPVNGAWLCGPPGTPPLLRIPVVAGHGGEQRLPLPPALLLAGPTLAVSFTNAPRQSAGTAVFDPDRPVELLLRPGGFAGNLARTLLVQLGYLALLAALGLAASAAFSTPVATLAAVALVIMAAAGRYFAVASDPERPAGAHDDEHRDAAPPGLLVVASSAAARAVGWLVAPVTQFDALDRLSDGRLVAWGMVGRAAGWLVLVYPAVLGSLGGAVLRRREIAGAGVT